MFFRRSCFVFLSPGTLRYSHDLMAKNQAPIASSPMAIAREVDLFLSSSRRTDAGIAFCCFVGGSVCE